VEVVILVPELKAQNGDMVVDFKKIKEIINQLDHNYLNEAIKPISGSKFNPTAENIAKYLHEQISFELSKLYKEFKLEVELWESPEASIKFL
jgi:6-pyruvoyl-tetrahydropterin synthase